MTVDLSQGIELLLVVVITAFTIPLVVAARVWFLHHTAVLKLVEVEKWATTIVSSAEAKGLLTWGEAAGGQIVALLTADLNNILVAHHIHLDLHALEALLWQELGAGFESPVTVPIQPPAPNAPLPLTLPLSSDPPAVG